MFQQRPAVFECCRRERRRSLAWDAAKVLKGEGDGGGEASECMNFLEGLTTAYAGMVKLLEESEDFRSTTMPDGRCGEPCSTTMPILCRLIQDAAAQAEEEWAARHKHVI